LWWPDKDGNDPQKLTWGEFPEEANDWWDHEKTLKKFSSLCSVSPPTAQYAIVWHESPESNAFEAKEGSNPSASRTGAKTSQAVTIEVFLMSKGEVSAKPLFASKSKSARDGFKEAVKYLARRSGDSQ
jgi:hypothetical protein